MSLLDSVIQLNSQQPRRTVALLRKHWSSLVGVKVAVLGLSFKPGTSDVRESPAFPIIRELVQGAAIVTAFDPVAVSEARRHLPDSRVRYCDSLDAALADVDAVIVVTPWPQFADLPARLNGGTRPVVLVDGRRAFDKASVNIYEGIGL